MFTFRKNLIVLSIGLVFLGLISCSKDSKSNSTTDPVYVDDDIPSVLSCTLVGSLNENFEPYRIIKTGSAEQYMIMSTSYDTKKNLTIYLYNVKSDTKTLDIASIDTDQSGAIAFTIADPNNISATKNYAMTQGTITITENTDKYIKGTFFGKTSPNPSSTDYLEIKNGFFSFAK